MKKYLSAVIVFSFLMLLSVDLCGEVRYRLNSTTGAIESLKIAGDPNSMEWLIATDGSQYPWVGETYGWGLGFMTIRTGNDARTIRWAEPEVEPDSDEVTYSADGVKVTVKRSLHDGELTESYRFQNISERQVELLDIGIFTPFNDNYPDAATCLTNRANVHLWSGDNGAYINAVKMGGTTPGLGLVVTSGAIKGYEIFERGLDRQNSQQRGIFALKLPDFSLKPGEDYQLTWTIFSHSGDGDFRNRAVSKGCPIMSSDAYVYCQGDTATIKVEGARQKGKFHLNGIEYEPLVENGTLTAKIPMSQIGHNRVDFKYEDGKTTFAEFMVFPSIEELIDNRAHFIIDHQQMNDRNDARFGAYMVYDNEGDSIYLNDTPNCNPPDRDEGRERVGMGVMLAKYYQLKPSEKVMESLLRYYDFLRNKLQDDDYNVYSTVNHRCDNRGYNYPWVANFYFQLYKITKDKRFALDGFQTMQALFRNFGYGFYCIEMPVRVSLDVLKDAGLDKEYRQLLDDYRKTGDVFAANSINYPKSEVNYEQSIVAPAVNFLLQIYQVTGEEKYLLEAERQLPVLEAFNGFQPSYHLNDIAIRHWDDYWFGKSEMFGDTFPHYWSAGTAAVFYFYSLITGDGSYMKRAKNIVNNNLSLFSPTGRASCAYVYPEKIDGKTGKHYDAYANDQDWALVYYFLIHHDLL